MAWTTAVWNDEFKIEFDVVVRKDLQGQSTQIDAFQLNIFS